MRTLPYLSFAIMLTGTAVAQERVELSLHGAIELAQRNSPAAEIAVFGFEAADWEFRAFKAAYRPSINFVGTAPGLDRNITEIQRDDGTFTFVHQSKTSSFGGLSIEQPLPILGGTLALQSGLSRIDQFGDNRFYQWRSTPVIVEWMQPLFQFNDMRWQRRLAPIQYEAARRLYHEDMAQIGVDVTNAFFAVYTAHMEVENAAFNVSFNDTTFQISRGRYDLGNIAENELLESELQWLNAQASLSEARIGLERALQEIKVQLGLPYATQIEIIAPLEIPEVEVDPDQAVEAARRNRAGFLAQDIQIMQAERTVYQARTRSGLQANLTARYGLNQSSDVFSGAYRHPLDQQSLQVVFRMPLYQWGRTRAELEAARAARDETERTLGLQRAELEQEVFFLAVQVHQLHQQVGLAAKADTIAARRFDVARNRYGIGKIDVRDLFLAQQAKDAARQAYFRALHQFWHGYYRLLRLTLSEPGQLR